MTLTPLITQHACRVRRAQMLKGLAMLQSQFQDILLIYFLRKLFSITYLHISMNDDPVHTYVKTLGTQSLGNVYTMLIVFIVTVLV